MKWIKRWNIWFVPGEEAQYRYVLYDGDQAEYTDYQAKNLKNYMIMEKVVCDKLLFFTLRLRSKYQPQL